MNYQKCQASGATVQPRNKYTELLRFLGLSVLLFMLIYKHSPIGRFTFITSERMVLLIVMGISFYRNKFRIRIRLHGKSSMLWGGMAAFQTGVFAYSTLLLLLFGRGSGVMLAEEVLYLLITLVIIYLFLPDLFRSADEFMQVLLAVTLFQCVVILLGIISPFFANLIDNCVINQNGVYWTWPEYRAKGYPGGLACVAAKGVMQLSLGSAACLYFLCRRKHIRLCLVSLAVVSVTMTAVARTGLIVTALAVSFILWDLYQHNKKAFQRMVQVLLIACFLFVAALFLLGTTTMTQLLTAILPRVSLLFERGLYNSFLKFYFHGSTTTIPPLSLATIIGGGIVSGTSGNGITINADGAFMRMYAGIGLPLTIVFYVLLFALMYRGSKVIRGEAAKTTVLFLLGLMLIGEFKEFYFYTRYFITLFFVFLCLAERDEAAAQPCAPRRKKRNRHGYQYNYVFFNAEDNRKKIDPDGYYTICAEDLKNMDNVELVSYPLDYAPYAIRCLFNLHTSRRLNQKIPLPFHNLWYPFYFRNRFSDDKPLCFVVAGWYITPEYIRYLKRRYPDCKVVRIYRDMVRIWRDQFPEFTDAVIQECFDLQMSFDEGEAAQYGFPFFTEFESRVDIPISEEYPLCDVFFAGKAKDRLPRLLEIYHKLTAAGYRCHYYLTGVPAAERIPLEGVEYAEKPMSYRQMLCRTVNSRCILEINQQGAVGYTSRFLEAVMFNKKLLTDNLTIRSTPFYNERFIQCFADTDSLDPDFIGSDETVDYHYNGEFSPVHLIRQIDRELSRQKEA